MRFMVKERKANSEGQKEYGPKALKMQIKVATHSHRHLWTWSLTGTHGNQQFKFHYATKIIIIHHYKNTTHNLFVVSIQGQLSSILFPSFVQKLMIFNPQVTLLAPLFLSQIIMSLAFTLMCLHMLEKKHISLISKINQMILQAKVIFGCES